MTVKEDSLEHALKEINKRWSLDEDIISWGMPIRPTFDAISTGSLKLDSLTAIGGVPRGRVTEFFGWPDSGKSLTCQHITAEAQKIGKAAWIDVEGKFDPEWARMCGVDTDNLLYSHPETGEMALEIIEELIRSGQLVSIVVDSVAALLPKAELEGSHGDGNFGAQAKLISAGLRKINGAVKASQTALIFINQSRVKVGGWTPSPQVVPETTSGGVALPFYASLRVRMAAKQEDDFILITAKVIKNHVGGKPGKTTFMVNRDGNIDRIAEIAEIAVEKEIINKSGGWYSYGTHKVNGMEKVVNLLREDNQLAKEIEERITNGQE